VALVLLADRSRLAAAAEPNKYATHRPVDRILSTVHRRTVSAERSVYDHPSGYIRYSTFRHRQGPASIGVLQRQRRLNPPPKREQPANSSLHVGGGFSFGVLIFMSSPVAEAGSVFGSGASLDVAGPPSGSLSSPETRRPGRSVGRSVSFPLTPPPTRAFITLPPSLPQRFGRTKRGSEAQARDFHEAPWKTVVV
jgi:hypothetical protein